MFERFTEKAINTVVQAQNYAEEFQSPEVCPEHVLLALVSEAKGVSLKIFRMYGMTVDSIKNAILKYSITSPKKQKNIPFSHSVKHILKRALDLASKSGNQTILFEHVFLSAITSNNSIIDEILKEFNFNINNATEILSKLVQKKIKKLEHPEVEEDVVHTSIEKLYSGNALFDVFERAVSKLSAAGYEILGTEQIVASILESQDSQLVETLKNCGLTHDNFEEKLAAINSRKSEYEDKKIIFTPNAFLVMNLASQIAKELGSSQVTPEHIVLSILKTKKGLAYEIIKTLGLNEGKLSEEIMKPIEKQMPETLLVMKLAKEEARRIGRNVIGTEMFLLGIIGEGSSVASDVLSKLGVTIRDARIYVENFIGYGNEYFDDEIMFTKRAKIVLEKAWLLAQKSNKQKIEAEDILMAITEVPDCIAMKVLDILGVDTIEIKQGILGIR